MTPYTLYLLLPIIVITVTVLFLDPTLEVVNFMNTHTLVYFYTNMASESVIILLLFI